MPVVIPSRASIETVNAVWKGDSFLAAIRSRPSSSQRSRVSARQIRPRPCVAMKLIASGVANWAARVRSPSFSRSSASQTTTILPSRMSSMRLLDRAEGRVRHRPHAVSFSTYLASTSTSRFTVPAGRGRAERRALERLGDQRHLEGLVVHAGNRQRHAVDGDRALLDHVAQQLGARRRSARRARSPPRVTDSTVPVPSTWPCTMWPPRRSPARSGSSRFTSSPVAERRRARCGAASRSITSAANAPLLALASRSGRRR